MTAVKAADLPVGSVVASRRSAWIKVDDDPDLRNWCETFNDKAMFDADVQWALDKLNAQVLREGTA